MTTDSRARFFAILASIEEARQKFASESGKKKAAEALEAALKEAYFSAFPRRRKYPDRAKVVKALGEEAFDEIVKDHLKAWEVLFENHKKLRDENRAVLADLAESLEIPDSEDMSLYKTVWKSTYSSQGLGAERYARNSAQRHADHADFYGLKTEVRRFVNKLEGSTLIHFEVWVACSKEDLEILDRKSGPTLREWVKACWKRGVNPRVYAPFLPHGYESQNGLDHFGNEVK